MGSITPYRKSYLVPSLLLLVGLFLVACQSDAAPDSAPEPVQGSLANQVVETSSYAGAVPAGAESRLGRGSLNAVAFSPDNQFIAVGGDVGIYQYSADTLAESWRIPTASPVISLAFSDDGGWLAAGSASGIVYLVNANSGMLIQQTPPNSQETNGVNKLAWRADQDDGIGPLLAVGFNDGQVAISHFFAGGSGGDNPIPTLEVLGMLARSAGGVTAMAFSPNGKVLATGDRSGLINLWDVGTANWFGDLNGHEQDNAVTSIDWSPEGDQLLTSAHDQKIILWDLLTFEQVYQLEGLGLPILVKFSPDGKRFAFANADGEVTLNQNRDPFDRANDQQIGSELTGVAFSPSWEDVVTISVAGDLSVWSLGQDPLLEKKRHLAGHSPARSMVAAEAWSPDGSRLATSQDNVIIVWATDTWDQIVRLSEHESGITRLAWSPDGSELASTGRDDAAIVWDLENGRPRLKLLDHTNNVSDLAYSPDGSRLITAGSLDNTAIIWDLADGRALRSLPGDGGGVWSVAWSPDGHTVALGLNGGHITLWDLDTPDNQEPSVDLLRHASWVSGVDFSPDGSLLASVSGDGRLLMSDLVEEKSTTFIGHIGPILGVNFSPDGAMVATAGDDGTTIIWNTEQGAITEPLFVLEGHNDSVRDNAWSPDSRNIATGSNDGTTLIWKIETIMEAQ